MGKKCECRLLGNLSGQVEFMFFYSVRHYFGHQTVRNGVRWRKTGQNDLFLEVFGKFEQLPDTIFTPNFKRR